MTIQYAKHVIIVCTLNIGDKVRTNVGGYKTEDKQFTVLEIKNEENCESGFMIMTELGRFIDSNWYEKINP
jgi:hypothetical protein